MLGGFLIAAAGRASEPLSGVLASGIEHVTRLHAGTCDMENPRTPAATVIIARQRAGNLEYLVLCDSVLLIQPSLGAPLAISDDRLSVINRKLRADAKRRTADASEQQTGRQDHRRALDAARNQPHGFWLAAADPAAAAHALTGTLPMAGLSSVALLSDGASRLADRFGRASWADVCAILAADGPGELIRQVRMVEASDPKCARWPRTKATDDATAIFWHLPD